MKFMSGDTVEVTGTCGLKSCELTFPTGSKHIVKYIAQDILYVTGLIKNGSSCGCFSQNFKLISRPGMQDRPDIPELVMKGGVRL